MESEDMEMVLKLMIRGIGLITEAMEFSLMIYMSSSITCISRKSKGISSINDPWRKRVLEVFLNDSILSSSQMGTARSSFPQAFSRLLKIL